MKKLLFITVLFLFSLPTLSQIEGVYTVIIKKQEAKEKSRWTLADWLTTKKTIALQDQWLALHSSENWFEFILDYGTGTLDESIDHTAYELDQTNWGAALYLKFLGLEYNSQSFSRDYDSSDLRLNLLVLGSSVQSTHIRGFYGERDYSLQNYGTYKQNFWGLNLTLYLASFLGVEGKFIKFQKATADNNQFSSDGERTELTGFIELWMLRLYATQYRERMLFRSTSSFTKSNSEGTVLGVKLFF